MAQDSDLFFGRYTREECGLPPVASLHPTRAMKIGRAVILLAALVIAGWLAGVGTARWREQWLLALPAAVARAAPADVPALLRRGRLYATALPGRPLARWRLAEALVVAAREAPRRLGYLANARLLMAGFDTAQLPSPEAVWEAEVMAAWVQAELGDYPAAFAAIERAEQALEGFSDAATAAAARWLLVNTQAYLLATAPEGEGRDPRRALALAELLVTSRDQVFGRYGSASAAFLDTLAMACHASGERERAVTVQRLALGLAEPEALAEILENYRKITGNAALAR
ncbi:MAG: hypothetical protein LIP77_08270 [Planctomycetes bacterium]|nr:hypothetical protein [Planctomycetota bacterium]